MKTIESLGDLAGKRVLVRSDFNVPLDADKNITNDSRIQAARNIRLSIFILKNFV